MSDEKKKLEIQKIEADTAKIIAETKKIKSSMKYKYFFLFLIFIFLIIILIKIP